MSKLVTFTCALVIAVTSVLVVKVFPLYDQAEPYGITTSFQVLDVITSSKSRALTTIDNLAKQHGCNIYKVQPDLHSSLTARRLYAFVGNRDKHLANYRQGYPDFAPSILTTSFANYHALKNRDLRGRYLTTMTSSQLNKAVVKLNQTGIKATALTVPKVGVFLLTIGNQNLAGTLAVSFLALALALFYESSIRRKQNSLQILHGYSASYNLRNELLTLSYSYLAATVVCTAAVTVYLALTNHFTQGLRFYALYFALLIGYYALLLAIGYVCHLAFRDLDIVAVLKGQKPALRLGAFGATVHILVLVLAIVTVNVLSNSVSHINKTLDALHYWNEKPDLYRLSVSVTTNHGDDIAAADRLYNIISKAEHSDNAMMVVSDVSPDVPKYRYSGPSSLIVNRNYLDRVRLVDKNNNTIKLPVLKKNYFTLLVPTNYAGSIKKLTRDWIKDIKEDCSAYREDKKPSCKPTVEIVRTKAGQSAPTFSQGSDLGVFSSTKVTLTDPVIAVIDTDSDLISPMYYSSYVSVSAVLFSQPETLERQLKDVGILNNFQGIDNAADTVTQSVSQLRLRMRMDIVSTILAVALMLLAVGIVTSVYCHRFLLPIFVRTIHGYRFTTRHRFYLLVFVLISVAAAVIALVVYHVSLPFNLLTAFGFVLLAIVVNLLLLQVFESSTRADYVKRG